MLIDMDMDTLAAARAVNWLNRDALELEVECASERACSALCSAGEAPLDADADADASEARFAADADLLNSFPKPFVGLLLLLTPAPEALFVREINLVRNHPPEAVPVDVDEDADGLMDAE